LLANQTLSRLRIWPSNFDFVSFNSIGKKQLRAKGEATDVRKGHLIKHIKMTPFRLVF
jgi:hypothetical protein